MIKDAIGRIQPGAGALTRLLLAFSAWRRRAVRQRPRATIDCLNDRMLQDVGLACWGFARWEAERQVTDWLYRG